MNDDSAARMASQGGLILRRQAMACGLSPKQITRLLHGGEWVAVRCGVYTTGLLWESLDDYVGRPQMEVRAASLNMVAPHVVSHDSAAYLHGLAILAARPRLVHITRFGVLGCRTTHGVKHHKAPFTPEQITFVGDLPVLDIPRTVADIAREHGLRHGVVAASSALRLGVTRRALADAIVAMRNWRHVTICREAVALADGRCESPGEALSMLMVKQLKIGEVDLQFGLRDGGRTAFADLRIGRHLVEFDGRLKFRIVSEGGLAVSPDDALWKEKQRQDWLCGFKLGMSRLTWVDVQPDRWLATQRRLLREITATKALFGTSIDDLAPYIVRRRL